MSTDVFSSFSALDELIQVIYQSIYKFVVLSSVTDDRWTVYMGLSDSEGRWWKGSWEDHDVHAILVRETISGSITYSGQAAYLWE